MAFTRATGRHRRPGRTARTTRGIAGIATLAASGVAVSISPALAAAPSDEPTPAETTLTNAVVTAGDAAVDNINAQADAQQEAAQVAAARSQTEERAVERAEKAKKQAQEEKRKAEAARKAAAKKAEEKKAQRADRSEVRTTLSGSGYVAPISGSYVSTPYKASSGLWSSGSHTGIDFHAASGTAVHAVGAGTVVEAGWGGAYGNNVVLKMDDGTYTQYGHLSSIGVSVGQKVTAGQQIALSGNTGNTTGPHLHFEARTGPDYGSDIDPIAYLRSHGVSV